MIKQETKDLIEQAVKIEYENACSYGKVYNSEHEAWAVIKEELEEAEEELDFSKDYMTMIWNLIKLNKKDKDFFLDNLERHARNMVAEGCQVLACIQKFKKTIDYENGKVKNGD